VLLDATVAVLAYVLVRRDAPEPLALGAWVAVAAVMAYPSIPHPNPTALALGFGALLLARRSPLGAGALAGLAVWFRFDLGLAAVIGAALAAEGRRGALRAAAAGAVVAAVLLVPFAVVSPGDFWDQTIGFALDQQSLQRLPLPGAWHGGFHPNKIVEFYAPYLLLGGLALWLLAAIRDRAPLRLWAPLPMGLAGVTYLLARADVFHLVPLAAVLPVLLATAAAAERRAGHTAGVVLLAAVLALIALQGLDRKRIQIADEPALAAIHVDVADGVEAPRPEARALTDLVRYVRSRVPPGQPIFVANPRFDLVTVGNPLVYVLANRPNPTRYDVMQPGVVTTVPVQREIVRDLERARPRLVVRWLSPVADLPEPNGAGRSSGVRILDRWLRSHYVEVRRFGDYAVLAPRQAGA
jgi:hypothetical protein